MCLALCLLALLLYPQVSLPLLPPTSCGPHWDNSQNQPQILLEHLSLVLTCDSSGDARQPCRWQVVEHKAVGTDVTWKIPDSGLFEK